VKELIVLSDNVEELVDRVEIIAFKKRALVALREFRDDWSDRFLSLLTTISQSQLRDYILKELLCEETKPLLKEKFENLLLHPMKAPETFVWYFQKLLGKGNSELPFSDKQGVCRFAESFLVLLHKVENHAEYRDLTKKMYQILTAKRYENIRHVFEEASLQFIKEFLLLASKCHTLTSHDHKILNSLASVVHAELGPEKRVEDRLKLDGRTVWTTEAGLQKVQKRAMRIGTIEIVENAREVEAARELGDLRENSEYKFAVERRRQLQTELKRLSEEMNRARVITDADVYIGEIGIGCIIQLNSQSENTLTYTILGPWDANPDENILSFQSKLAQTMIGRKVDDKFTFRDEEYQIMNISSYLDK